MINEIEVIAIELVEVGLMNTAIGGGLFLTSSISDDDYLLTMSTFFGTLCDTATSSFTSTQTVDSIGGEKINNFNKNNILDINVTQACISQYSNPEKTELEAAIDSKLAEMNKEEANETKPMTRSRKL